MFAHRLHCAIFFWFLMILMAIGGVCCIDHDSNPPEEDEVDAVPIEPTEPTEPAPVDPSPGQGDGGSVPSDGGEEPAPTEPAPAEPAPTEPAPTEPAEPVPTEPAEPAPTEPAPTGPAEPVPTEPVPAEPVPEEEPEVDQDLDGVTVSANDCDDTDASTYPGATEICDGKDNDCDELIDVVEDGAANWQRSVCGAVLLKGSTSVDGKGNDQGSIIYNEDLGLYQMWFRMVSSDTVNIGGSSFTPTYIGYAESRDGVTWTKQSTPVLSGDYAQYPWEGARLGFPSVLYRNGGYQLWYQGQDNANVLRVGYATSLNGREWTRSTLNPVLSSTVNAWDSKVVQAPSVLYEDNTSLYRMWYTGGNGTYLRTGYAESTDGATWIKLTSYVVDVGEDGAWDDKRVVFARIHQYFSYSCSCMLYHMWYSGDSMSGGLSYEIGHAASLDGLSWTKDFNNPIFSFNTTSNGNFDEFMVYAADVILFDSVYSMFYSGGAGTNMTGPYAIGIAVSLTPDLVEP